MLKEVYELMKQIQEKIPVRCSVELRLRGKELLLSVSANAKDRWVTLDRIFSTVGLEMIRCEETLIDVFCKEFTTEIEREQ